MRNKLFLWLLLCCITSTLFSQPPEKLPNGDTKTTTVERDAVKGTVTTTEEFRKADGTLRGFRITFVDAFGNRVVTDSATTAGGRPRRVTVVRTDGNNDTLYAEERNYDARGKTLLQSQIREYDEGIIIKLTKFKEGKGTQTIPLTLPVDPGPLPATDPETKLSLADHKVEVFAGYSYLSAGTSGDNISFALGAHVDLKYKLTNKLALRADVSYHTKKDMDIRTSRMFIMGGAEYKVYEKAVKDGLAMMLVGRLMAGLAADRQKFMFGAGSTYNVNAFAIAAGLGLLYPVNSTLFLQLMPDYILTRFNDESQSNFRLSVGAAIKFGGNRQQVNTTY